MKLIHSLIVVLVFAAPATRAAEAPKKPINLLFIITDQQRFDALGCMGNKVLKTPNAWLERTESKQLDDVKKRPVIAD